MLIDAEASNDFIAESVAPRGEFQTNLIRDRTGQNHTPCVGWPVGRCQFRPPGQSIHRCREQLRVAVPELPVAPEMACPI